MIAGVLDSVVEIHALCFVVSLLYLELNLVSKLTVLQSTFSESFDFEIMVHQCAYRLFDLKVVQVHDHYNYLLLAVVVVEEEVGVAD